MGKVLLLGDLSSAHMVRWIREYDKYYGSNSVELLDFRYSNSFKIRTTLAFRPKQNKLYSIFILFLYLVFYQRKYHYVHAFYATSYGLLLKAPFSAKKVLSVWGSDILIFPKKSSVHKWYTKFLLMGNNSIYATSETLRKETVNLIRKHIIVVPYGIDFIDESKSRRDDRIVKIGFVKKLDTVYNQELMLRVFDDINNELEDKQMQFHVYGDGPLRDRLEYIAKGLKSHDDIFFYGSIANDEIETAYSELDIVLNISISESFGVSVLEALNYGCAVIVSNIPAFKELLDFKDTDDFFIDPYSNSELKKILKKYILESKCRQVQVSELRTRIISKYNWKNNVNEFFNSINE